MPAEFGGLFCFFGFCLTIYVIALFCMPNASLAPEERRGTHRTMKTPEAGERYRASESKARIRVRKILNDDVVEYDIPPLRSILRATKEEWSTWTKVD